MAKRRPLKKVNLALLRKQHADAKRQMEKSQREYEEAAKALEEGETSPSFRRFVTTASRLKNLLISSASFMEIVLKPRAAVRNVLPHP